MFCLGTWNDKKPCHSPNILFYVQIVSNMTFSPPKFDASFAAWRYMRIEKKPWLWTGYIRDEILPSYMGIISYIIIRIPSLTIQYFMESRSFVFFVAHMFQSRILRSLGTLNNQFLLVVSIGWWEPQICTISKWWELTKHPSIDFAKPPVDFGVPGIHSLNFLGIFQYTSLNPGVIILPTQTMHYFLGTPSKLP